MTSSQRTALLIAAALSVASPAVATAQTFSADQRQEIGTIVKDYLLAHPEVLQDVMAELEKRQQAADAEKHRSAVAQNNATLFSSPHQVVLGNPHGNVTMVEFFDYNCGYCKRALPDMLDPLEDQSQSKVCSQGIPGARRRIG